MPATPMPHGSYWTGRPACETSCRSQCDGGRHPGCSNRGNEAGAGAGDTDGTRNQCHHTEPDGEAVERPAAAVRAVRTSDA